MKKLPVGQREKSLARDHILLRLFPEGLNSCKIWTHIIIPLQHNHEPLQVWEQAIDRRMKIKERIRRFFPEADDQFLIIHCADVPILRTISRASLSSQFQPSFFKKKSGQFFEILLVGSDMEDFFLDLAAVSVVSLLIGFARLVIVSQKSKRSMPAKAS